MRNGPIIARLSLVAGLALAVGLGTAAAQEFSLTHAQGKVTLPASPQKIAVFDLSTLDIIQALGKSDLVVAVPKTAERVNFPAHLTAFAEDRYASAGSLFEPDARVLESIEPDLIVLGGRSRGKFKDMGALAPTIDMSAGGSDIVSTVIANTEKLGSLLGAEDAAATRVAAFRETIAKTHELGAEAGTGLLLFGAGENIRAEAPGSRFGAVYDLVGIKPGIDPAEPATPGPRPEPGSPEAEAARQRQQEALEAALASEPDWIFTIDRNFAVNNTEIRPLPERLAEDERVTATKAWQEGRVVHLDGKIWYLMGGGIDAMTASAEAAAEAFAKAQ